MLQWLVALFVVFTTPLVFGKQTFDRQPEQREVNPGEDTVMICRVFEKSRNSLCIWQKDGKPVRLQNNKYEWDGSPENGDCSLRIMSADISYDDGEWKCQVTSSSFDADDALSSKAAKLIVRIPPAEPRIYYNGQFLSEEKDLSVKAGEAARLRCESRGGNPPALLKWFIDDEELPGSDQKNETDIGNSRRWNAIGAIEVTFHKEHHGKRLKCVALHEAYPRRARERATDLDILYAPVVRLDRDEGGYEFEADVDETRIRCVADANPPPDIVWRKAGGESIFRIGEYLLFEPVREDDGGTYFCLAKNDIGSSDELSVTFEVLYPPRNVLTKPKRFVDLEVGTRDEFECEADANPPAHLEWLQKLPDDHQSGEGGTVYARGQGKTIKFRNITYEHEGKWACSAKNIIKGKERKVQSEPITVEVTGKPQVLLYRTDDRQEFSRNAKADIKVTFCSDPRPRKVVWEWGSLRLLEGESRGRFKAQQVVPDERKDCYSATLNIIDVLTSDTRFYYLTMANDRGESKYAVNVRVSDPVAMSTVIGVAAAAILLVILLVFCLAYTFKSRKACFKHKGPAFERDANFRIFPTHQPYVAEHSRLPSIADSDQHFERTLPCEQPLGIPTYAAPLNKRSRPQQAQQQQAQQQQSRHKEEATLAPMSGTVTTMPKRRPEPTYPLPPRSQFPLAGRPIGQGGLRPTGVRKTPQNVDTSPHSSASSSNNNITYAELQFSKFRQGDNNNRFQSKFKHDMSEGTVGSYYPRARDRADV